MSNDFGSNVGMVQICSECNSKHINSAETMMDKHSESGRSLTYGNGGRFSPSDSKSQANSDSSYVRFKVFKCISICFVLKWSLLRVDQSEFFLLNFRSHTKRWQRIQYRAEIVIREKILDQIHHWHSPSARMDMDLIREWSFENGVCAENEN